MSGVRRDGTRVDVAVQWSSWLDVRGDRRAAAAVVVSCPEVGGVVPWSERMPVDERDLRTLGARLASDARVFSCVLLSTSDGAHRPEVWCALEPAAASELAAAIASWPLPHVLCAVTVGGDPSCDGVYGVCEGKPHDRCRVCRRSRSAHSEDGEGGR